MGVTKKPVRRRDSIVFAIIGVILLATFATWKTYHAKRLSFNAGKDAISINAEGSSVRSIQISKTSTELPVIGASIKAGVWEVAATGASHLATSANPGTEGNIVIYAHNSQDRFGKIRELDRGDSIKLVDRDGLLYEYEVMTTKTVSPDQIEDVLPTDKETLTLYTCTGFADSKRFIVKAQPVHNISQKRDK